MWQDLLPGLPFPFSHTTNPTLRQAPLHAHTNTGFPSHQLRPLLTETAFLFSCHLVNGPDARTRSSGRSLKIVTMPKSQHEALMNEHALR